MSYVRPSPAFPIKPELSGQIAGYWYGPDDPIPPSPISRPTGALLPVQGSSIEGDQLMCLDLVPVQSYWVPLSVLGRYTYRHSTGLLHDETWYFVPVAEAVGGWPARFAVTYGEPLRPEQVAQLYGEEAAERCRPDTLTVQLELTRVVQSES